MNTLDASKLATSLMTEHGLTAHGWHFQYDKAIRRFGATHYGLKQITLSRKLVELNEESHVKNTILHEIAHALAGHANGHNYLWQATARAIGCDGERTYKSAEVSKPTPKFTGTCPNCKRTIQKHRRNKIACGRCCNSLNGGRFDSAYLFVWTS